MPVYRMGAKLVYYVHVLKCAETSLNVYLEQRFGAPAKFPWSQTSTQHVDVPSLWGIFRGDFVHAKFAVLCDPVARLESVFQVQKYNQKRIFKRGFDALGYSDAS